jgi:hypothetical protein
MVTLLSNLVFTRVFNFRYRILKKSNYWLNLKDCAEEYVKTCLTYQQNRTLNKKQAGLLQPLPIPEEPWESVSLDFMVSLPPSKGFDAIMVVVD